MTVAQLEYFLLVGKKLNFTKAADELFVSQSVLSRQIASLEQELGFRLFDRERRGLSFTPAGKVFFTTLEPQAKEFKKLLNRMESFKKSDEINVSFGLVSLGIIQPKQKLVLDILRSRECGATISIVSKSLYELVSMLLDGKIDLMCVPLRLAQEYSSQLSFFPLTENRMFLVYSSAASGVSSEPKSLSEFANVPIISLFQAHRQIYTELCKKQGFVPRYAPPNDDDVIPNITVHGYAHLTPEWSIVSHGDLFDSYLIEDFPKDIDVLAWRKDNTNPAISLIEAKKPLLCLEK